MRPTLHLVTAEDYLLLWPAVQPALIRALAAFFGKRARGLDVARLVGAARALLEEQPRSFAELRAVLSELEPDRAPEALAYAVRSYLPRSWHRSPEGPPPIVGEAAPEIAWKGCSRRMVLVILDKTPRRPWSGTRSAVPLGALLDPFSRHPSRTWGRQRLNY
jgi:hypothetical protein